MDVDCGREFAREWGDGKEPLGFHIRNEISQSTLDQTPEIR
jgi:hypothetical protein